MADKDVELGGVRQPEEVVERGKKSRKGAPAATGQGEAAKPKLEYQEHELSFEELESKLKISLDKAHLSKSAGLSREEAAARLARDGPNALTPAKELPWYMKLLAKFLDPFMILLELAAILCFIMYAQGGDKTDPTVRVNLWIAIVLLGVVTLTSVMSYVQEGQAGKVMNSFKSMMSEKARVRRGGQEVDVPSEDLVVGDLVVIDSGNRIPADLRILSTDSLKVENSSFTGEPEPVELTLEKTDDEALHSKNLAFNSAMVVEGKGLGLVVRTGDNTMIGSIATLVGQTKEGKSTLEVEVVSFVHFISILALVSAVLLYAIQLIKTCGAHVGGACDPMIAFITVFVPILVANVPEGLPATVTSCLTVCAQRLAARHVFVKRLDCIETLGSCTVVASDKTGTLTQNKMTVSHLWVDRRVRTTDWMQREADIKTWETFQELVIAGSLCNMCKFEVDHAAQNVQTNAGTATVKSYHLMSGILPTNSQYTLSKRPATANVNLTLNSGSVGAQRADPHATILNPNFFEGADGGAGGPGSHPSPAVHQAAGGVTNIARQYSGVGGGAGVGRQYSVVNSNTIGRQKSVITASLLPPPPRKVVGNPSDMAIFNFCHSFKDMDQTRAEFPQLYIIPFNSRLKWMKTIHRPPVVSKDQRRLAILKGAPEIVLKSCSHYVIKNQEVPIDAEYMKYFEEVYKEIAGQGERVLGFARKRLPLEDFPASMDDKYKENEDKIPHDGYVFVGLISLIDPPKEGVPDAVLRCKNAGIRVMMITGDHPLTAEAIAKKVNIIRDYSLRDDIAKDTGENPASITEDRVGAAVIMCKDLEHYTEQDWKVLLDKPELVFARASPQDKLTIVQHLRARDEVVAVTGDGVNDSPALKNSDIGIAMGIMGTEVAKSAANVVLMDDDFCSIINGIEEGRVLFDNLTKTIAYTLTHLVPELMAVVINIIFSIPYGMSSLMILSIDLLTEVPPAISFAWEKSESNVMDRPPRNRKVDRLVRPSLLAYAYLQAGVIEAGACLLAYFFVFWANDVKTSEIVKLTSMKSDVTLSRGVMTPDMQMLLVNQAMTAYYATLVLSQFVHVFICKTRYVPAFEHGIFNNTLMNYGVLIELGIMVFIIFVPGMDQAFMSYRSLAFQYFCVFLISGTVLFVWNEFRKWMIRRDPTSRFAYTFAW